MSKTVNFHPRVCAMLVDLRVRRQNSANEERNMIAYRNTLKSWFSKTGDAGDAPDPKASNEQRALHSERLKVFSSKCVAYTRTLMSIDQARLLKNWLAGKYDSVIDLAINGRLSEDALDEALAKLGEDAPPMPLFHIEPDDEEAEAAAAGPVGEKKKPSDLKVAVPPSAAIAFDAGTSMADVGIAEKSVLGLRDVGLITLGDLMKFRAGPENKRLTLLGVNGKDELALEGMCRVIAAELKPKHTAAADVPGEPVEKKKPGRKPKSKT